MANGKRTILYGNSDKGGRDHQLMTDRDIQLGPPPGKIARTFDENIYGIIDDGNYNFINPFQFAYMRHINIGDARSFVRASRMGIPAFSETAEIKAFSAGDNLAIINR